MIVLISLHADRDESFKVNAQPRCSTSPLSSHLILMNVQELDLGLLEIGTQKREMCYSYSGPKMFKKNSNEVGNVREGEIFFLLIFLVEKLDLISDCSLVIFWLIFTRTY